SESIGARPRSFPSRFPYGRASPPTTQRREERTADFVAARIDVADLGPGIVATRAADPLPQRKRDLDPVLEHEGRARLEDNHRSDDECDGDEAESAERPQALRARGDRSDDKRHDEAEQQDRHGHRIRGDWT